LPSAGWELLPWSPAPSAGGTPCPDRTGTWAGSWTGPSASPSHGLDYPTVVGACLSAPCVSDNCRALPLPTPAASCGPGWQTNRGYPSIRSTRRVRFATAALAERCRLRIQEPPKCPDSVSASSSLLPAAVENRLGHPAEHSTLLCPLRAPVGKASCEPRSPKQPEPPYGCLLHAVVGEATLVTLAAGARRGRLAPSHPGSRPRAADLLWP
jgi:hypothetical protein